MLPASPLYHPAEPVKQREGDQKLRSILINSGQTDKIGFVPIDKIDMLPALEPRLEKSKALRKYITQQSMLDAEQGLKSCT